MNISRDPQRAGENARRPLLIGMVLLVVLATVAAVVPASAGPKQPRSCVAVARGTGASCSYIATRSYTFSDVTHVGGFDFYIYTPSGALAHHSYCPAGPAGSTAFCRGAKNPPTYIGGRVRLVLRKTGVGVIGDLLVNPGRF